MLLITAVMWMDSRSQRTACHARLSLALPDFSWFLGVADPQLRKSLHLHAVLGGLGFRDLDALLTGFLPQIAQLFVRVWRFVASICFRSPEAYACLLHAPLPPLHSLRNLSFL